MILGRERLVTLKWIVCWIVNEFIKNRIISCRRLIHSRDRKQRKRACSIQIVNSSSIGIWAWQRSFSLFASYCLCKWHWKLSRILGVGCLCVWILCFWLIWWWPFSRQFPHKAKKMNKRHVQRSPYTTLRHGFSWNSLPFFPSIWSFPRSQATLLSAALETATKNRIRILVLMCSWGSRVCSR